MIHCNSITGRIGMACRITEATISTLRVGNNYFFSLRQYLGDRAQMIGYT